jgi:hypothetical protein
MTVHKAARLAAARARIMAAYRAGCIRTAVVADRSQSGRSPRSGQQGAMTDLTKKEIMKT